MPIRLLCAPIPPQVSQILGSGANSLSSTNWNLSYCAPASICLGVGLLSYFSSSTFGPEATLLVLGQLLSLSSGGNLVPVPIPCWPEPVNFPRPPGHFKGSRPPLAFTFGFHLKVGGKEPGGKEEARLEREGQWMDQDQKEAKCISRG